MVRKNGDLQQTKAGNQYLLSRSHTMFCTKMLHDRLPPLRETEQSMDQVGFRKGPGTDHALAGFETVCRKSIEWNSKICFASLDLTKAFDHVAQDQLFQTFGGATCSETFHGLVEDDLFFSNYRGIRRWAFGYLTWSFTKQGDILTPMLFIECCFGMCLAEVEGKMWTSWRWPWNITNG